MVLTGERTIHTKVGIIPTGDGTILTGVGTIPTGARIVPTGVRNCLFMNLKTRRPYFKKVFWEHAVQFLLFRLFTRTPEFDELLKQREDEKKDTDYQKIRCPLCSWRPLKSSRWYCADCDAPEYFYGGCYTSWNTFDTRGKCPTCAHQWIFTSCLKCYGWSRHEDWYEEESG